MKLKDIKPGQFFSFHSTVFLMLDDNGWVYEMNRYSGMNIGWVGVRLPLLEQVMFKKDDDDDYELVNPEDVP